jgi:hypothetical protein
MLAKLSVAFNQKPLGNSDLVSNTAKRSREEVGITVTLPKPMTSNSKAEGHFGKQDLPVFEATGEVSVLSSLVSIGTVGIHGQPWPEAS